MAVTERIRVRHRRLRRLLLLVVLSVPVFMFCQYAAYWLRFEGAMDSRVLQQLRTTLPWLVVVKVLTFAWFRVYQGWNRFVSFYDLVVLTQASAASSLALVLLAYFLLPTTYVPRSVFLIDCIGTIAAFSCLRAGGRLLREMRASLAGRRARARTLIVGTSDSAEQLLRAIRSNPQLSYQIVGFISRQDAVASPRIGGVPVLGGLDRLAWLARRYRINELLMMSDEFSGAEVRQIIEVGQRVAAKVNVLPSFEQLLHNRFDLRPRTVSITDLLRREPVRLDMRGLHHWIDGRVLLVTGSAGSIGSEICRQLLQFEPRRLVVVDRSENGQFFLRRELAQLAPDRDIQVCVADVGDAERMDQLLAEHQPNIIFHAAAYKHVPLMEDNAGEAVKNIVLATKTLADLAEKHDVDSFVMISTDKAVNPTSVMGACKRVAEMYVQALSESGHCHFVTVRFGNVLDSAGSVVPIFREQIAAGGPVTVTHPDMQRYFMMIPEASQLVIQAGAMGRGGEIFVLNMGPPVKIVDLAREMINLSGLEVGRDIEIQFTGMRPGEKLFEELHNQDEQHRETVHPKIMVADSMRMSRQRAGLAVEQLAALANGPTLPILGQLQIILPQYQTPPVPITNVSRAA